MMLHALSKKRCALFLLASLSLGCGGELDVIPTDYGNFDPDHVVQVDIEMDEADWEALRSQSRSFFTEFGGADCFEQPFESPYTYFHASIEMDGESLSDVGVRKKGFIGSQSNEKPGFRINLDEYVEGAQLFGTDNLTLNNSVQDPSLIRQCLTYGRFREAGLPAPRCNYAHVSVNGTDMGIYVHVEPVKRQFLRDHFGNDDGNLYEGTLSDFQEAWYRTFEPKTDETDVALTDIVAVMEGLQSNTPVAEILEAHFNLDNLLSHLAMEQITAHWDGYSGRNHNNFYIYDDPTTGKFSFIPWGADGTMSRDAVGLAPMAQGAIGHHMLADDSLAKQYEQRVLELLEITWDETEIEAEIDRMETLLAGQTDLSEVTSAINDVRTYVAGRRAKLEGQLPGKPGELDTIGCMEEKGSMEATFESTWGTLGQFEDLTQVGELEMYVNWNGNNVPFARSGVGAGWGEDGSPLVVMVGLIDPSSGATFLPVISFDPATAQTGEALTFGERAGGGIYYTDNNMGGNFVQAGFYGAGSVTFESVGTQNGDTVRGTMNATIWAMAD